LEANIKMDYERMYNKEPLPTYDEIRNFIGNTAVKEFDKIITFIEENYDFNKEICYGGKNYGVMIRFKRSGKTLIYLCPKKNLFFAEFFKAFVISRRALVGSLFR